MSAPRARKPMATVATPNSSNAPSLGSGPAQRSGAAASEAASVPDPQLVAEMKHEINVLVQEVTQLAKSVVDGTQAIVAQPSSGPAKGAGAGNPSELLVVLAPLIVEQEAQGVVEIFQRPGSAPSAQRGYLRFLVQMCDLACGYLKSRRLRQLEENQTLWRQLETLVGALHRSL